LGDLAASVSWIAGNGKELIFATEDRFILADKDSDEVTLRLQLEEANLLKRSPEGHRRQRAYCEELALTRTGVEADVRLVGDLPRERLEAELTRCGVRTQAGASLRLLLVDDYLRPGVREAINGAVSVLLAKPVGVTLWLGPLLTGECSAQYQEVAYWLTGHRAERARIAGWRYPPAIGVASSDGSLTLAIGWVSSALSLAAKSQPEHLRKLLTLDLRSLRAEEHVCFRQAVFRPEEWISNQVGIVSRVLHESEGFGLSHAAAEYCLPRLFGNFHRQKTRGYAYGSGENAQQAREKAVYEAVERFSSYFDGEEDLASHCYEQTTCVHPNEILQISGALYEDSAEDLPERFREGLPIAWMWGRPLGDYPGRWIPAALVLMDYRDESQPNFAYSSSNGTAAGPSYDWAVATGLREVIERDAVALWWYRQVPRPSIERELLASKPIAAICESLKAIARDFAVLDLSTEFGLSVCVAISTREDGTDPVFGAGSGESLSDAAVRAAQELTQVIVWRRYWGDEAAFGYPSVKEFMIPTGRRAAAPVRQPLPRGYAVELTRRRVGLPVVKVFVPGLLPPHRSFGGTRWKEPPATCGWDFRTRADDGERMPACPL